MNKMKRMIRLSPTGMVQVVMLAFLASGSASAAYGEFAPNLPTPDSDTPTPRIARVSFDGVGASAREAGIEQREALEHSDSIRAPQGSAPSNPESEVADPAEVIYLPSGGTSMTPESETVPPRGDNQPGWGN